MRLVFPSHDEFLRLFGPRTRTVWICSPWVNTDGAALLHQALARCTLPLLKGLEVWVRLNVQDRQAGLTDYFAIDQLLEWIGREAPHLNITIWTAPNLHAKIFWTEQGALVGSANLTSAGFGGNIELAVRLEPRECAQHGSVPEALRSRMEPVDWPTWKAFLESSANAIPQGVSYSLDGHQSSGTSWEGFLQELLSNKMPSSRGIR